MSKKNEREEARIKKFNKQKSCVHDWTKDEKGLVCSKCGYYAPVTK